MLFLLLLACHDPKGPAPDAPGETAPPVEDSLPPGETADTADTAEPGTPLLISEVMSDNHGTLEDGDGDTPDWIELYNPGPDPVDLAGWTLSDSSNTSTLPAATLLGGAFLVVFASGKSEAPSGEVHVAFKLDNDGEPLTLTRPDGSVAHEVEVPALAEDISWGLNQTVTSSTLLTDGDAARLSLAEETGWQALEFDDSAWQQVVLGIGFDGSASGGDPVNAASGATTSQSTDGYGYTGAQAVDEEPATFSHTGDGDLDPWWEVDLGTTYTISSITLLNRADCCAERLYNITVSIADPAGETVWTSEVQNPVAEGETPTTPGSSLTLAVEPGVIGRSVRVSKAAFSGSEWLSLAEVVVTGTLAAPYASAISTEIAGAPAYVRVPFSLEAAPSSATLEIAYDDGFLATLDGSDAAEANAGDGLASAEHDGSAEEDFALDPRLLGAGPHVLALTALNASVEDDDLLLRPTLRADWIETGEAAWFKTATPGEPNGEGFDGFLDPPVVDPPRGFYDAPFVATITGPPGATLVYTTDGTVPALDNGTVVLPEGQASATATLSVNTTSFVRAMALAEGFGDSEVVTHTWLFLEDVLAQPAAPAGWPETWDGVSESPVSGDYEMDPEVVDADPEALLAGLVDIPTLSVVTDPEALFGPEGLYENSAERGEEWEKAVSVEWILEDGSTGFQEDCGLRVHGYGWRYHSSTKKHSFRLEFSREYGDAKLEYPVFADAPVDRFDSIVLRAGGSKTWLDFRDPANAQYLHDAFARDTARDMGKLDGHATYVHLYLNGLYWGLYNPVERPEAGFGEEYLGGDDEDYDAINRRTVTNEAVDGTLDAYNALLVLADEDLSTDAGLAAVESMLDLDDLIDYMLIHQYTVNRDGPCCFESNNMRGLRRREDGELFRFFVWDMEYSLWESTDDTNVDIDVAGSISHVYARLRENTAFRARYSERAHLHLTGTGALTPEAAAARYQARAEEIYGPLLAESARWGDTYREIPYTRDVEWQAEYDRLMTEFFPSRTDELIAQLEAAGLWEP